MKLLTKEIERALKKFPLDSQDGKEGICVCKFFNPCGRETWYVTEGTLMARIGHSLAMSRGYMRTNGAILRCQNCNLSKDHLVLA